MTDAGAPAVRFNPETSRFEAELDGHVGYSDVNRISGGIVVSHTEVPQAINGRGVAGAIFRTILDTARAEGLRVVPVCPVFALWLKNHPEAHDLVDPGFRRSLGLPPA